jgi:hypothetical protein
MPPVKRKETGTMAVVPSLPKDENDKPNLHTRADSAPQDLAQLTAKLSLIADWRAQLAVQLRRAELLQDLGLLTADSQDRLARRVDLSLTQSTRLPTALPAH